MRVDRQTSTVDFPEATETSVSSNGSLMVFGCPPGHALPEKLGEIAKGCWTHWTWVIDGTYPEAQDLEAAR